MFEGLSARSGDRNSKWVVTATGLVNNVLPTTDHPDHPDHPINDPDHLPVATKIRRAIRQQVEDVQWARDVQDSYRELKRTQRRVIRSKLLAGVSLGVEMTERCVKCTLPLGTCEHYQPTYSHSPSRGHNHGKGVVKHPPSASGTKGVNRPMGKIEFDDDFFEDMGEVGGMKTV